ncbi:MAG: hypothetical protein ACC646_13255, partial [Paracoccaceae bacterium]
ATKNRTGCTAILSISHKSVSFEASRRPGDQHGEAAGDWNGFGFTISQNCEAPENDIQFGLL